MTDLGVNDSIVSIIFIVSSQVAPCAMRERRLGDEKIV